MPTAPAATPDTATTPAIDAPPGRWRWMLIALRGGDVLHAVAAGLLPSFRGSELLTPWQITMHWRYAPVESRKH